MSEEIQKTENADPTESGSKDSVKKESIKKYPAFLTVWAGQTLSAVGTQMVSFALGIWIFQQTGSVIQFGLVIAAPLVVAIVLSPIAGVIVDKFNRKNVMLVCELGLVLISVPIVMLAFQGKLDIANIMMYVPAMAVLALPHQIAYASAIPLLVPKPLYGKANGLVQLGLNGSAVLVPMYAVLLLEGFGIAVVLVVNLVSYVLAMVTLMITKVPSHHDKNTASEEQAREKQNTVEQSKVKKLINDQLFGIRYLMQRRVLGVLLIFVCSVSFLNTFVNILFRPMVLMTESTVVLGWLTTIAGVGGLIGAIGSGIFASKDDKVKVLSSAVFITGFSMILCGLSTNNAIIAIAVFIFSFAVPVALVVTQTMWQTYVPVELQGRVFATRTFFFGIAALIAVMFGPWLSETIFEPQMMAGNYLAEHIGQWFGTGPGRGTGLMFILAGLTMILITSLAIRSKHLRQLRHEGEPLEATTEVT